ISNISALRGASGYSPDEGIEPSRSRAIPERLVVATSGGVLASGPHPPSSFWACSSHWSGRASSGSARVGLDSLLIGGWAAPGRAIGLVAPPGLAAHNINVKTETLIDMTTTPGMGIHPTLGGTRQAAGA